jgi:hypothetical protein
MSLIHENSCACVGSQLDLFTLPGTQTSQEKNTYVPHYPISSLADGPLEFDIKPSSMYTDLGDTRLYLRCKVVKQDGSSVLPAEDVTVCNMFMNALIHRLDVYVGDKLITQSGGFYPWKSTIETILNFGTDAKTSQLASVMYHKDTTGQVNLGAAKRKQLTMGSKGFELFGPLHVDFFFQDKYLLNNVPMRVKITRTAPAFHLVSTSADACKVEITEAVLWVRRIQVAPAVEMAHSKALISGKNAVYPIRRGEVEVMAIPPNQTTVSRDNLFMSRLPKKVIIAMVDNERFNGIIGGSPFEFNHFDLGNIELSIDGENVCGTPLSLDFNDQKYMRAYMGMFHAFNKSYTDNGSDITYDNFKEGYALMCFDLTADGCGTGNNHLELTRQGNLRFKMQFNTPLARTMNVVVYGEFESILEITHSREVLLDYKN